MPLPKPRLDDKNFNQLVDEAKKLIPRYTDRWTDHNWSDPGITFIDLFAWLTEITLYRIDLLTDSHRLKYLKLLGASPEPPAPAYIDLTFEPTEELLKSNNGLSLKAGDKVYTEVSDKKIYFELAGDLTIAKVTLKNVIVNTLDGGFSDRTDANEKADLFYFPFGPDAGKNSELYLGFDMSDEGPPGSLSFTCYLYEKDLGEIGKHGEERDYEFVNSKIRWEYYGSSKGGEVNWMSTLPCDGTSCFKRSGKLLFTGLDDWEPSVKWGHMHYWLRCILEESSFEYPPRIETIRLNTVPAVHGLTIRSETAADVWISNGMPDQVFKLKNRPVLEKTLELSISEEYLFCWDKVPGSDYENDRLKRCLEDRFSVKWVESACIQRVDADTLRILSEKNYIELVLNPERTAVRLESDDGRTYGFAGKTEGGRLNVYDGLWEEVEDFNGSGPGDNHFVLDRERGEIIFGDGLYGRVPLAGSQIDVIKYRTGGGEEGNINAGNEWKIEGGGIEGYRGLRITNYRAANGGKNAETIKEATERFRKDMETAYTAVTGEDFENIAKNTPGLRVAKTKAIPHYHPETGVGARDSVTVVVIPDTPLESFKSPPVSSSGFLNAVCRHLDKHRLLGTEIHVIPPRYIKVDVNATIVPLNGYPEDKLMHAVEDRLKRFLHPIKGGEDGNGWQIGRMVYRSEVFEVLEGVEGVDCITRLSLSGDKGSSPGNDGNLNIPPDVGTVYPGRINVSISKVAEGCRKKRNRNGKN